LRRQIAEHTERRRQRFRREELNWVRAGVKARTPKSPHRLEKFYEIEGLEAPPEEREMDLLIPPPRRIGNVAIELEDVEASVGEEPERRVLFRNLNISFKPGECTGIVGRNGVGKTTLLDICMGRRAPDSGTVTIGKRVVFNYIDQTRMVLDGGGTVFEEIAGGKETIRFGDQSLSVRAYLRRFLFDDDRINERVELLSGGERARLLLAKVLKDGGNVIVLDEPTNDLDLASLRILEEALADFEGTVLVVSHDRYFLDRICDRIIAFEDHGLVIQPGNYSYYLEKKLERDAQTRRILQSRRQSAQTQQKRPRSERPRKLTFKEKAELESIEDRILAAEENVASIEAKLSDPRFFVTHNEEAVRLAGEIDSARKEVARLYERWEELEKIRSLS
jgi:ATP-binding cassette subfamily F protein uup